MRYHATIRHHSISRARVVPAGDTLAQAKRAASREFGGEQNDYELIIIDTLARAGANDIAARRRLGAARWTNTNETE